MTTWFQRWIVPRADAGRETQTRQKHILSVLLLGGLAVVIPYGLLSILGRLSTPPFTKEVDILISGVCFAALILAGALSYGGWLRASSVLGLSLIVLLPSIYFYNYQDVENPGVILYAVPVVIAGLLLGVWGSATVAIIISLLYAGLSLYAHYTAGREIWPLNIAGVASAVGLIVLSVWLYVRGTNRMVQRLQQQTQELQTTHQEKSQLVEDLQALTAQQRELLDLVGELAAPVIPVQEGVIVLPLVGHVDEDRAKRMVTALLEGIAAHRARVAVVDVTGVPMVDSMLAQSLLQMAQGARLLGATCVLSGLRTEVAHTLSRLDVSLDMLVTSADVQSGIEYAQRQIEEREM
jgi:anti-anti-sigma regulatory factor